LSYYSKRFDAVELDTTFYALPDEGRGRRWAESVGSEFRFSVKTPRDVTHAEDVGRAGDLMVRFTEVLRGFGEKLFDGGVVLLQFPPSFVASRWRELEGLVRAVPEDVPLVAEFRHSSWWAWEGATGTMALLGDYDVGWASADYVGADGVPVGSPRELRVVEEKGGRRRAYVRLIGQHERYTEMNREMRDPTEDLVWWKERIEASGVGDVWVLLNNDYAGFSVATGERLKRMLGMEVRRGGEEEGGLFR
jgi:uncharacterized protein YecE (DUF72 family)